MLIVKNLVLILSLLCVFSSSAFANSIEITSLTETVVKDRDVSSLLIGATEAQISEFMPNAKTQHQILAFFVKAGENEILFDTGLKGGNITNELVKNGKNPDDIKIILLTHLHPDHFGGLVTGENKAAFKNAEIYISKPEYKYWLEDLKDENIINAMKLYEGHLHLFDFGDEVVEGVKAIDTIGHTPGHTSFLIQAGNEKLLIVGDIMHFIDIQLPVPDVAVRYDVDPEKAIQSRKFILDYASQKEIPIAGMHIKVPGIIRVKKSGSGYEKL